MTPEELNLLRPKFEAKYVPEPNSGCWMWDGTLTEDGYGKLSYGRGHTSAHRLSVRLSGREIPDKMHVDHLCRTRCCVNPDHLEVVTHQENVRRGEAGKVAAALQRAKTHCPQGHEYTADNLRAAKDGRLCKACHRIRESARYHEKNPNPQPRTKTHCPSGHELTGENLFVRSRGGRECRTCMRERNRRNRNANR